MRKLITVLTVFTMLTLSYAGDGKVGGLVFYDYSYDLAEDAGNINSFALQRVYFTYKQKISDGISYKFQTDINYKNSPKNLYLKNAKVDWESPLGKFTIGLQGMNVFNVTEKTWGFRFIEKSPMDLHKFSSSADMGIGYNGKFNNLNYSLMITNGTGYKNNEDDEHKKMSVQLVYGEKKLVKKDGYNGGVSFTMEPYEVDSVTTENKTVISLFGGFAGGSLRVGGEFDMLTDAATDITEQIIAFYASYAVTDKLEGLVYIDMFDPNTDTDNDGKTYIIAGMNFSPDEGLIITPNIRMTTPEEGDKTTILTVNFQFKF
ncbi:MAG: hypothetical protein H8E85_02790 [Candidatus Marinimicrobia bacterium]|nr:hypothetical protein [Candidatus Neomarinimicrobiota bacterium]